MRLATTALGLGKPVVDAKWLYESIEAHKAQPFETYRPEALEIPEIKEALESNRSHFLQDYAVFVAIKNWVGPSEVDTKLIIRCAGGRWLDRINLKPEESKVLIVSDEETMKAGDARVTQVGNLQ